jgi:hypothetical protein
MFQRSIDLQESEEDAVSIPSHPTVMNVDGVSAYHFHQLLKQMLRDEGVMRGYNAREAAIQEQHAIQQQLGQSFKLTAGSMTRNGVFCLNTPAILEGLNERERAKAEKDQQANERERVKSEREKQHFEAALNTYKRNRNNLKVVDLKALINRFRVEADPPIGQSKQQLSQQWSDIEPRLLDTMNMYNQDDDRIEAANNENQAFENMPNHHDHNISI